MNLKKLDKQISELQDRCDVLSGEFAEYEDMNHGFETKFKNVLERLGKAVMERAPKATITDIEKEKADLATEFDRFCAAGPQIDKKILELELELKQKKDLRNQILGKLAVSWLKEESDIYDQHAEAAIKCIKRLIVGYRLLMDAGQQNLYRETIGDVFRYLPGAKIPVIKGFNATTYNSGASFHAGRKIYDQVLEQIEREGV